jgi:hypothetical protein
LTASFFLRQRKFAKNNFKALINRRLANLVGGKKTRMDRCGKTKIVVCDKMVNLKVPGKS